jgi:lipopolysaccharide/colanic/teichoic acid biosynthesis glycosyltransferase
MRPGVTSYATIYNGYTDTMEKMLKRLEYDLEYLDRRTVFTDLWIMLKTFFSVFSGKKF